ncbi:MAG: ComF family protein [Clostridia bacterium]|mgnify:FL=1
MFKYTDIRREILEYKFDDKAYYYKTISQVFLKNKKICEILKTYDIIIPVPIHNKRRQERGYNQSALIAKEFSKNINELEYEDILIKKKNTIAQSTLNKEERLKNAIDMYKIKENKQDIIYNKNVLIFDDIYTTGATANECAKAIREADPSKVGILTIAKD